MKTSNKILITIGILAAACVIFRSVLLSIGVPQIAKGHNSPFINLVGETNNIEIDAFTDLSIESEGFVKISVKQGPKTIITGDKNLDNCIKIKHQWSLLQISYKNNSAALAYLNITSPFVKSISISNPEDVDRSFVTRIDGFTTDSLILSLLRLQGLTISNCKIKNLNITSRSTSNQHVNLQIKESNQIENLMMDIQGRGWMNLASAGTESNNYVVSDSVGITTSGQVLKMLKK